MCGEYVYNPKDCVDRVYRCKMCGKLFEDLEQTINNKPVCTDCYWEYYREKEEQ